MTKMNLENKELSRAILSLRISALIYLLLAIVFPIVFLFAPIPPDEAAKFVMPLVAAFFAIFGLGFAVFIEIVCRHLKQGRYWAWIAGLILSATYIPSCFIVMGIISFMGLIKNQHLFQQKKAPEIPS